MQQLLINWMLIGILQLPADKVGLVQAATGIPGIFLMLWGGASADRRDARKLLVWVYGLAPGFPLALIYVIQNNLLNIWTVTVFGLGMSVVATFSSPAQQSILSRIAGSAIQQAITASTAIANLVQMIGLSLAGQMDRIGLSTVLLLQAICLATGAAAIHRLGAQPPLPTNRRDSTVTVIIQGFRATYANSILFDVLIVNFVSSIFNAGSFMTVFPFIIKRVYDGNALLLAAMMIAFFGGAVVSNFLMLRYMPLARPGRVFLSMQLTRIVLLFLLWIQPGWWLLVIVIIAWGFNMGVTSTLARAIVQESAAPEFRARILSVYSLGLLGSAPIGAIVLGWIIEHFGTLNALIPGMVVSFALFAYGVTLTGIWRYRSPGT